MAITLNRAIEVLSESAYAGATTHNQEFKEAEKLGVEALKRVKAYRNRADIRKSFLLPGEKEE